MKDTPASSATKYEVMLQRLQAKKETATSRTETKENIQPSLVNDTIKVAGNMLQLVTEMREELDMLKDRVDLGEMKRQALEMRLGDPVPETNPVDLQDLEHRFFGALNQ